MNTVASLLAQRQIRVFRFEFPYMAARHIDGRKRPPDCPEKLQATWREVMNLVSNPHNVYHVRVRKVKDMA